MFLWIERKIEGDRPKQMKLDRAPWNVRKVLVKLSKHTVWILLSLWTGYTFVGFFTPIRELGQSVLALGTGPWETFWIFFYGFATYGNAGWLREQVCIYMCPYARFQSAMFDHDTLIVSYDPARGEPRGARRRSADPGQLGLGDCVDCTLCVQACPTGIDIRNGLQYQCISCAACIDACDDVMDKMGYARGLIRFTTENALQNKPGRILRPRTIIYGTALLVIGGLVIYSLLGRVPVALDVIRDRNSLYRETADGLVENVYTLKLINKDTVERDYIVKAAGIPGLQLKLDTVEVKVPAGEVKELSVRLEADPVDLRSASSEISFELVARGAPQLRVVEKARFIGPRALR